MKNRKSIIIAFLLVACMIIGVGYATVTDNFVIEGHATISQKGAEDAFNEDVRFEGIVVNSEVQGDVLASLNLGYTASCNIPQDSASFHITDFKGKGDTKTITFRVKNYGDIDAIIKLSSETATNNQTGVFSVDYKYATAAANGTAFPAEGVTLATNEYVDVIITVTVINSVNTETTGDFTFKFIAENPNTAE